MKAKEFCGSHIKAEDLQGRDVMVQIREAKVEELGQEKDKKVVIYFQGKEKGLALNMTNTDTLIEMFGTDETDDWVGQWIVLYKDRTKYGGKMVDCIRIKAPNQQPQASPPPPPRQVQPVQHSRPNLPEPNPADDIPF